MKLPRGRVNKGHFIYAIFYLILTIPFAVLDASIIIYVTNFLIIGTYVRYRPKYFLHPNNLVFAFYALFFILPSSVEAIYYSFNLERVLPVSEFLWLEFKTKSFYDIAISYLIIYMGFLAFVKPEKHTYLDHFHIPFRNIAFLYLSCTIFLGIYLQLTGGVVAWITNYKEAFLLGRGGVGAYNFFVLFYVNLTVFCMGLYISKAKHHKIKLTVIAFLLIIFAAYIQGLKSRFIILLAIFYLPYLVNSKVSISKNILFAITFFVLLFIGNYIRSNGYYNSLGIFIEYTTLYFNAFQLHDLIVSKDSISFGQSFGDPFIKFLISLKILPPDTAFDISIRLTQEYFPNDWDSMRATQQWPLLTDLHYNYFGLYLGWIPLLVYTAIIAKLYNSLRNGNIFIGLIFILEFFRIFSTLRGALIPWQIFIYLLSYYFYYRLSKKLINKRK